MLQRPDKEDTPVPQCLETSWWGSGDAVQSGVVNRNESRGLGNANSNRRLPNTTALTSLIKARVLPFLCLYNKERGPTRVEDEM